MPAQPVRETGFRGSAYGWRVCLFRTVANRNNICSGTHLVQIVGPILHHHAPRTLNLLAEYDFDYTCDLYHDDQVQAVKTATGDLVSIPYSLEVNDHYGFFVYNMSGREYADTLVRQFERLASEGGTVMCIPLHAYLIGQPHRIGPFEEALEHIAKDGRAWLARAGDIVDAWRAQV